LVLQHLTELSRRGVEYHISKLKQNNIIERIRSKKEGYWNILKNKKILDE